MAFDFPPAQDGLRVTNPESGVTYVYRDKYQSWIIEAVDNKQVKIYTVCCTPCDAAQGDLWFNPCTNCLNVYHDGDWLPVVDCSNTSDCVGYKGEVQFDHQLPATGNELGDLWIVLSEAALYVYSTRGWIPADRYDDTELRQLIQEETDAREAADKQLNQKINKEKRERKEEDQNLWDALKQETSDRVAGDEALYDKIEECCTNAQDGLADIQGQLDQEIKDRELGDGAQQSLIDHLTADLGGTNDRLDQEIQDRIDGDQQLQDNLDQEKVEREAYDEHLLGLINSKESKWMGEVPTYSDLPDTRYDWVPLTDFRCSTIYSMTWGPDRFIAGSSDGHIWSSDDGLFWERRNVGIAFNGKVTATFHNSGVWLLGGDNGLVSRSLDGISWSNYYSTTTSNIQDFAFGNGTYVYVTDGGVVATSPDGVAWTKQDHTIRWGVHGIDSILTVTWSDNLSKFVAGTARGMILISDTGMGWDLIDPRLSGSGQILTIVSVEWAGQPTLIAGGDFPQKLIYSVDGINWVYAPRNPFKDAFPTDLKDCGTHVIAALSDGHTAFAFDALVQSWTLEATGGKDRLLAIAHAPQNANIGYPGGLYVTGGNFGQAYARMPGKGLEPGDTWVVLDEMCLYTWSTLGWVTSCGDGSGGGGVVGIRRLTSNDGTVTLTPPTGVGDIVDLSIGNINVTGGAHYGEDPPANPDDGDLWIRDPLDKLYFWNGSFWVELTGSGGGGGGASHIGEKPPVSAGPGDLWVREPELSIYVWTGSEWVQTNAVGGPPSGGSSGGGSFGPTFPSNPQAGDRHVDENSFKDYVYTGDEWIQVGSISSGGGGSSDPVEGLPSFGPDLPSDPEPGQRHVLEPELIDYVWTGDEWIQMNGVPGAKRNVGMLDELNV